MHGRTRDPWLDFLRAAAVLLVLGRHMMLPDDAHPLLVLWQRGGWIGVDLFFVLSGYLIACLLFRERKQTGSISLTRFLVRRGLRIYPAFYLLLFCTWLVHTPPGSGRTFLAEIFFVQNYLGGIWNHTWSLAIEEHFYIGLPMLLLAPAGNRGNRSDPFRALLPMGCAAMIAVMLARCFNYWQHPYTNRSHLFPTHLRLDALLAGVLLAYCREYHADRFERWVRCCGRTLLFAGLACFIPAFVVDLEAGWFVPTLGLTLFSIGGVLVVAAGVGRDAPRPIRWLAPVGAYSYSIYLWHMPALTWAVPLFERVVKVRLDASMRNALYLVTAIVGGIAMAWLVEIPVLWLRERWIVSVPGGDTAEKAGAARIAA